MKEIENQSVLVATGKNRLCIAIALPFTEAQLRNAVYDCKEKVERYVKRLSELFKCSDLDLKSYSISSYNNAYNIFDRSLAEELEVDEFSVIVEIMKESINSEL